MSQAFRPFHPGRAKKAGGNLANHSRIFRGKDSNRPAGTRRDALLEIKEVVPKSSHAWLGVKATSFRWPHQEKNSYKRATCPKLLLFDVGWCRGVEAHQGTAEECPFGV